MADGIRSLFWKGDKKEEVAVEPTEVSQVPSGPLKKPASLRTGALRPTAAFGASRLSKVNSEKLADLRKRVLGGTPTALTQIMDQASKLAEAGIDDPVVQYRGAIKTTGVSLIDLKDALSSHKTNLLSQREGFAKHVVNRREQATKRRADIQQEADELNQRLQALITEDGALDAQLQELEMAEAEFTVVADTLDAELAATGEQLTTLYQG